MQSHCHPIGQHQSHHSTHLCRQNSRKRHNLSMQAPMTRSYRRMEQEVAEEEEAVQGLVCRCRKYPKASTTRCYTMQ